MPRNGSGVYDPTVTGGNYPAVYDTIIDETKYNTQIEDIADALTASLAKDGQTTPTANLPMGGYKLTGLGAGSASTDSAHLGQVQAAAYQWCGTAGGTANALTLTPSPAISAYAAGQVFRFKAGASANSGATTVAISGLSAIAVQFNGAALSGGEIEASKWYEIVLSDTSTAQLSKIGGVASIDRPLFIAQGGTEGGEILLEKPASGTTLADNVSIDVSVDYIRFFENGGSARGVKVDLTTGGNNAGSLVWHDNHGGYSAGYGGTVTQLTSKSTGITLNKPCGQITMHGAALAADTTVSFVFTNSYIEAGDVIILNHTTAGTFGSYMLNARSGAGACTIDVRNVSGGSLSEAILIRFAVIKAVTS